MGKNGKAGCNKDIAFGTFEAPTAKHPHGRKYGAGGWRKVKAPKSKETDDQRDKRDEVNTGRKR